MKAFMLLAFALLTTANAKIFDRCELARKVKASLLHKSSGYSIADWVCLAHWGSNYNSMATTRNSDGSSNYGIFQINSRWWCNDFRTPYSRNGCGANCFDLLSDRIDASIKCANRIARDPDGMTVWMIWRIHCHGHDLRHYVVDCGV